MKNIQWEKIINKDNANSFLFALVLCAPMISSIIYVENIIPTILAVVLFLLIIINYKTVFKKPKINYLLIGFLVIFALIIFYQLIAGKADSYFIERISYFAVFGIFTWVITSIILNANNKFINIKKVINCLLFIYAIISLFIYNTNFWRFDGHVRMAMGYYMLPLYISIIMEFFIDKNKSIVKYLIKYIAYAIIYLPYFNFFLTHLPRGAFLGLSITLLLCILYNRTTKQKLIIISVLVIILCIVMTFALDILKVMQTALNNINISFSFINKNIKLLENNKLGDGRDIIYGNAMKGIMEHPILGNGIGNFKLTYNTYPHNIALQLWYEGGIPLLLLFMTPVVSSILIIFITYNKEKNENEKNNDFFLIFLFGVSIIKLLLSYEFWSDIYFWIYMYMSLSILFKESIRRGKNYGKHSNTNIQKS